MNPEDFIAKQCPHTNQIPEPMTNHTKMTTEPTNQIIITFHFSLYQS